MSLLCPRIRSLMIAVASLAIGFAVSPKTYIIDDNFSVSYGEEEYIGFYSTPVTVSVSVAIGASVYAAYLAVVALGRWASARAHDRQGGKENREGAN